MQLLISYRSFFPAVIIVTPWFFPALSGNNTSFFGSGSRALMTKNWKKFTAEKKIVYFFDQKFNFSINRPS
jgi:hypothetical protein